MTREKNENKNTSHCHTATENENSGINTYYNLLKKRIPIKVSWGEKERGREVSYHIIHYNILFLFNNFNFTELI